MAECFGSTAGSGARGIAGSVKSGTFKQADQVLLFALAGDVDRALPSLAAKLRVRSAADQQLYGVLAALEGRPHQGRASLEILRIQVRAVREQVFHHVDPAESRREHQAGLPTIQ